MDKKKKVLVIGVIGADVHAVGNKILYHAFTEAGFDVVNLGVMVSQEEYISAAIESGARDVAAQIVTKAGCTPITLHLPELTKEERQILLEGCLMNYYAAQRAQKG